MKASGTFHRKPHMVALKIQPFYELLIVFANKKTVQFVKCWDQSQSHLRKEGHDISMLASLDESRLAFSSIGPTAIGEKTKTKTFDLPEFITLRPVGHSDMKRAKSQNCNGSI